VNGAALILSESHVPRRCWPRTTRGDSRRTISVHPQSIEELEHQDRTLAAFRVFRKPGRPAEPPPASLPPCTAGSLQLLERAAERVGQAPHGKWLDSSRNRLKVQVVHSPRQMLRKPCFFLNEGLVDKQLGGSPEVAGVFLILWVHRGSCRRRHTTGIA
jgi:hypothetical protein